MYYQYKSVVFIVLKWLMFKNLSRQIICHMDLFQVYKKEVSWCLFIQKRGTTLDKVKNPNFGDPITALLFLIHLYLSLFIFRMGDRLFSQSLYLKGCSSQCKGQHCLLALKCSTSPQPLFTNRWLSCWCKQIALW
jgi:hypothetical protein